MPVNTVQDAFTKVESYLRNKFLLSPAQFNIVDNTFPNRRIYEVVHYKEFSINKFWLWLTLTVDIQQNGSAWATSVSIAGEYTAGLWFAPPLYHYEKDLAKYQIAVDHFARTIRDELNLLLT